MERTTASSPIRCSWNYRTKINTSTSCCNVDIGLMWVEQQRSIKRSKWTTGQLDLPLGQGLLVHSFNHCVAKDDNTSWTTEVQWTDPSELEGSFLMKGCVATTKQILCCLIKIMQIKELVQFQYCWNIKIWHGQLWLRARPHQYLANSILI